MSHCDLGIFHVPSARSGAVLDCLEDKMNSLMSLGTSDRSAGNTGNHGESLLRRWKPTRAPSASAYDHL